jgi:hypothetical protein
MRRILITVVGAAALSAIPLTAHAQTTPTPTTLDVETTTGEQTATTVDVESVADDDDSDKTGLWGLAGLLGLLGLAGLAGRKRRDYDTAPPTIRNPAPPTSSGATRTDRP